ncbi:MAG: phosphoribosylformylglycinamidine cyclo-ligase [Actinobacteria bacterium HGW-Actinobacteria-2]|nr:MAG: phosphoribosylformylglycinamidine cyclo-ligase [Actinobacteria bacterium HGW-Actinobacteria-2]
MAEQSAYAAAGVDIEAGDRAVELMKGAVARSHRPEVMGGLGGFAGFFDASALAKFRHPVLATSTDGVGTKVAVAQAMGVYDTIGWDLIGMLVDDLVVTGAEPLFVTDYIACGKVFPERIAAIVGGIAAACTAAGAALIGGETAEHPGLLGVDDFDIAGATTGVVERDEILGPDRVVAGDVALALASSGLHSNGYSLVRKVFADAGWGFERDVPEFGRSLGEELLTPTRVYARDLLAVIRAVEVHSISHITGGGLANNLVRVLPAGITVDIDRTTWTPPAVFDLVQRLGAVSQADIEATLNQGVGMVALLPQSSVASAQQLLSAAGVDSWVAGTATASSDGAAHVHLHGTHPAR